MRRRRARGCRAHASWFACALALVGLVFAPAVAAEAAEVAPAAVAAPAGLAAPMALPGAPGTGCNYAKGGTGTYAETLCWIDFSQSDGSPITTEYSATAVAMSAPTCTRVNPAGSWRCDAEVAIDSLLGSAYGRVTASGTATTTDQNTARDQSVANATTAARRLLTAVTSGSVTKYYGAINNYPITVALAGGYVLTANLSTTATNSAGYVVSANPFPTWGGAFLGNNNFYTGVAGNPAFYQRGNGGATTFRLSDISLAVKGVRAGNFSLVVADAESTDSGESISWTATGAGDFSWMPNTPGATTKAGTMGSACSSYSPAIGATAPSASCSSDSTVSSALKTGTAMLMVSPASTTAPFSVSTVLVGSGLQAGAVGIVITRAQANVKVTDRIIGSNGSSLDSTAFAVAMNGISASTDGVSVDASTGGIPFLVTSGGTPIDYTSTFSGGTYSSSYTVSWQCYKTDPSSATQMWWPSQTTSSPTPPSSAAGQFARLTAGQFLSCTVTYTPPYLTLSKTVVNGATGASGSAAQFTLNAAATGLSSVSVPGTNTAKKAVAVGSYALTESTTLAGYDWTNLVCTGSSGNPSVTMSPASPPYTSASVPIAKGAALTCSLTNTARTTTLTWDKTDVDTGQLIGGSTWTLVGPSGGASSTITVADDTGQAGYTGRDTNPAAGRFTVTGLPWGTYTLTETQAPTGYTVTGSALTVVLGGATTTVNAGTITNTRTLTFGVGKYRYAASGLGPLLDGGAFSVLADNAGQPGTVVPGAAVTSTGSTGMFTMTGLRPGTYWLAETKAPAGHQLLAQPIKFAVVYNATNTTPKLQLVGTNQRLASLSADAQTLRVSDVPTLILPLSGGSGWALPAAIGVVLLLAVIGWAGWRRRRTDDASDSASRLHASPRTPREDDHENH